MNEKKEHNADKAPPLKQIAPWFPMAFGLMLVVIGALRVVETETFMSRAERTTGSVVSVDQGVLILNAGVTVNFTDAAGTHRSVRFDTGGETTRHKPGDAVAMLYDRENPEHIYIGNPRLRRHPVSGIFLFLGAGLVLVPISRMREDRRPD